MAKRKTYSLNALATETARNFRTLSKALSDVRPDGKAADGKPRWYLATAVAALAEHERRTGRVPSRQVPERYDPMLEAQIREIEESGRDVDAFLAKLRAAATVELRREIVQTKGRVVGKHERALTSSIGDGSDAFLCRLFVDEQMRMLLGEIATLCAWHRVSP